MKQPRTKRAEVWSCLLDGDVICFHHSKAAAADCPCGRGTSRPSHLVEHLPGDVLLSREDAEAQESDGYARGVAAERARVVAWLRARAIEESSYAPNYIDDMADAIERGEHEEGA